MKATTAVEVPTICSSLGESYDIPQLVKYMDLSFMTAITSGKVTRAQAWIIITLKVIEEMA